MLWTKPHLPGASPYLRRAFPRQPVADGLGALKGVSVVSPCKTLLNLAKFGDRTLDFNSCKTGGFDYCWWHATTGTDPHRATDPEAICTHRCAARQGAGRRPEKL